MATMASGAEARHRPGLIQSLKGYLRVWLEVLRTRLELVTNELEEERERIQQVFILAAVTGFCMALGALMSTFFVVVLFWDSRYRLAVVAGLALIYLAAGVTAGLMTRQKVRQRSRLFAATLGELTKDCQNLSS